MTKMYGLIPDLQCTQHVQLEHAYMHRFTEILYYTGPHTELSINGFIRDQLVIPRLIGERHDELVEEFALRRLNHKSELEFYPDDFEDLGYIDLDRNYADLLSKCNKCRNRLYFLEEEIKAGCITHEFQDLILELSPACKDKTLDYEKELSDLRMYYMICNAEAEQEKEEYKKARRKELTLQWNLESQEIAEKRTEWLRAFLAGISKKSLSKLSFFTS